MTWLTNPYRFGEPELIRDFGTSLSIGSGDAAMTLPPGDAGQLLIAHIGYRDSPQFTAPGGWTIAYQASTADTSPSGTVGICIAYKTRGASESAPTFTRTGGANAAGYIVGYTPNRGSLTFGSFTQNNNGGASSTTHSTGALTSTGSLSLLSVSIMKSFFWTTPAPGLSAASLGASATSGTLVPSSATAVLTTEWQNAFFAARTIGTGVSGLQGFDLLREGAGSSGTISVGSMANTGYHAVALDFGWLP